MSPPVCVQIIPLPGVGDRTHRPLFIAARINPQNHFSSPHEPVLHSGPVLNVVSFEAIFPRLKNHPLITERKLDRFLSSLPGVIPFPRSSLHQGQAQIQGRPSFSSSLLLQMIDSSIILFLLQRGQSRTFPYVLFNDPQGFSLPCLTSSAIFSHPAVISSQIYAESVIPLSSASSCISFFIEGQILNPIIAVIFSSPTCSSLICFSP